MKAKTIKQVLRKRCDAWLATIEDQALRKDLEQGVIITGGCIASMLLREPIQDFDVYFRNKDLAARAALYYAGRFSKTSEMVPVIKVLVLEDRVRLVVQSAGVAGVDGSVANRYYESDTDGVAAAEYVKSQLDEAEQTEKDQGKYQPVFLSANAITLSNKLQLVIRFFGEPDEIHANYDFAHCLSYWTSWDNQLVLRPAALEALLARELRYIGSRYPLCSIIRTRKFIARGWTINAGQYLKMCYQLNALDLTNLHVLEDQLTGVDTAYFMQMIDIMRKVTEQGQIIDDTYLAEVVDRLF